jgi:hypothetical protein
MSKELERRLQRIDSMEKAVDEKLPRVRRYMEEFERLNIQLNQDDLVELTLRFASDNDERFFKFVRENHPEITSRVVPMPYVPPSAAVVSTELTSEAAVAAVLGIGIGWVWAWLAVSPWSATTNTPLTATAD